MNILAYQDIQRVEEHLFSLKSSQARALVLPSNKDLASLDSFQSQLFKQASSQSRAILGKKLCTGQILVTMGPDQENGAIRMFIYNLLVVIYGPPANNSHHEITPKFNSDLLNNLKCSLYCKDIKFSQISNSKNGLKSDEEGQMLAARFFDFLEHLQKNVGDKKIIIKCIQWVLQKNRILLQIFILFIRFILMKLQVEGAQDYFYQLRPEQVMINLIQYFDLSYKCSEGLILFYQEGYFLTFAQKEIIFGQYGQKTSQNQYLRPGNQKLKVQTQSLKKSQSEATKKSQNQLQVKNHFLRSSCQSQVYQNSCYDQRQQTVYRHENIKLQFQRRKEGDLDFGNQKELRKEFARVISDSDCGSEDRNTENLEGSNNLSTPPTPTWCKESNFVPQKICDKEFRSTIELSSNIFRRKNMDPIHEVDQVLERTKKYMHDQKNPEVSSPLKNLVKVVDRGFQPLSPQAEKAKNEDFSKACDENFGFFQDKTESYYNLSGGKVQKMNEILQKIDPNHFQCRCRHQRMRRNACNSKVVQFTFQPHLAKKQNFPGFLANRSHVNVYKFGPQIKITPPKETKNTKLKNSQVREDRIPAFLKSKKEKASVSSKGERQSSNGTKKIIQRQNSNDKETAKEPTNGHNFKRHSQIIFNQKYRHNYVTSSLKKHNSTSSPKNSPQQAQNLKKYDSNQIQTRPSLGQPEKSWKKKSNCFNSPPYCQNLTQFGQFLKQNDKSNTPFRFFAPVQIIAPTVYLHSTNTSEGQVIFNLNKQHQRFNTRLNESSSMKGPNLMEGLTRELNSNRSEKILKSFQQKYL